MTLISLLLGVSKFLNNETMLIIVAVIFICLMMFLLLFNVYLRPIPLVIFFNHSSNVLEMALL